jgi:hypothetical protein
MYVGCNGETCIYACCIVVTARICGKILFLSLTSVKGDFKSAEGNEKGLLSKLHRVR